MKIRTGFVSNSSSTSFCIPSFLLTDEQKELLLTTVDDGERAELYRMLRIKIDPIDYPKNEDYHRIYNEMLENDWADSGWTIQENKELSIIHGSTMMGNGSIQELMEKIGIDLTILQSTNHGHGLVRMATDPQAVKHFIWLHEQRWKFWEEQDEETKKFETEFGHAPYKICPYALSDDKFEPFGETALKYEQEIEDDYQDCYSFVKDKNED